MWWRSAVLALALLSLGACQIRPLYMDASTGGPLSPTPDLKAIVIDPLRESERVTYPSVDISRIIYRDDCCGFRQISRQHRSNEQVRNWKAEAHHDQFVRLT